MNRFLKHPVAWIYVVAAVALLPALLLRDLTPDNELRYLSIADEALRNGSLFCFSNHGELYADKPPLYLWIVMAGRAMFGQHCAWFIGLFSLVPMLLCGAVMDRWVRPLFSVAQRRTALLMLFTCGYFPGLALTLRMDMLMTLWILLALHTVYRLADEGSTRGGEALVGLFTFLALFTKGPLGVLIPVFGSLAWLIATGRGRMFRHIWGWPAWSVLLGGCMLWFGGVYLEGGAQYLDNLLFHQTVDRSVNAFTHARPWWYYLVHVWYIMAPWSLVIAWMCVERWKDVAHGQFRRMMIAVFLVTMAMLSCISSKLQVYLLPAIPFGVYLGASLMKDGTFARMVRIISLTLLGVIFLVSFALPWFNSTISYSGVCREAAGLHPNHIYVDTEVRRGENIDACFPGVQVTVINSKDSTFTLPKGGVLILPVEGGKSIRYESNI